MLNFFKSGGLGAFSLRKLLHAAIAGWEPARDHKKVHASDIVDHDFCPRQYALLDLTQKKKKGKFVSTAQRVTYEYGHFLQSRLTEKWLRDKAWGDWRCRDCYDIRHGPCPVDVCKCGAHPSMWAYNEVAVVSDEHGVSGGIDVLIQYAPPTHPKFLRLVEIKTLDKDEFKELKAPVVVHRKRTALYLRLASLSKHPLASYINTDEATILYVSKSFGFKDSALLEPGFKDSAITPFKEFVITRDDASVEDGLQQAKVLHLWRKNGGPLPKGVCPNSFCKQAKSCSVVAECFSGKFH